MTDTRSDRHRPSVVDPSAYEFLGAFYTGTSEDMADAYRGEHPERVLSSLLGLTETEYEDADPELLSRFGFDGNFKSKGTCDHCGAHFAHGVFYLHRPFKEVVAVGHTCAAETFSLDSRATLVRKRAEKAAAAGNKARKVKDAADEFRRTHADVVAHLEEFSVDSPGWVANSWYADNLRKIDRYGSLFESTVDSIRKGMARDHELRAARVARKEAEEAEDRIPVPERRLVITGEVLSVKWKDSMYGGAWKMLVKDDRGFKVWGTRPDSLSGDHRRFETEDGEFVFLTRDGVDAGDRIRFTAATEPSHDDEFFGFFKRPTKAEVIERKEATATAHDEAFVKAAAANLALLEARANDRFIEVERETS